MTRPALWPRSTDRLVLRPPTEADLDAVLSWRNNPDVTRWLLRTGVDPAPYRDAWASGAHDPHDHSPPPGSCAHGKGYATEMVVAALDLAFGDLGLRRVTAGCFADDVASWRVMEKAGMRREQHGIRDSWHADLGWIDGYTYGVLADEGR